MRGSITLLNVSKAAPGRFAWFDGALGPDPDVRFVHCEGGPANRLERRVGRPNLALHRACAAAGRRLRRGDVDLAVSHLPVVTLWTEVHAGPRRSPVPHVAFAFNHAPVLPTGVRLDAMRRAFERVERFVVFTDVERELYADVFRLPVERFDRIRWGVREPPFDPGRRPLVDGDYVCAVGRTGRDFGLFVAALRRLPDIPAVVVGSTRDLAGLDVPPNVAVLSDIAQADVVDLVGRCRYSVLPLVDSPVPFGHATGVLAMTLGRAVLVNDGPLVEYVDDGRTGMTFPSGDVDGLVERMRLLWDDHDRRERLAAAGQAFAVEHCTEEATRRYVSGLVRDLAGDRGGRRPRAATVP